MKKSRKMLALILTFILVFSMGTTVLAARFSDTTNHWASSYIDWATDTSIVEGYPDGTFKPEGQITHAEFYAMINRLSNYTQRADINFTDVESADWFYNEVAIGVEAGYLTNRTAPLNPNTPIIRDEASRIFAYIYGLTGNANAVNIFSDAVRIQNRAAVGALVDNKIIHGYPNGTFKPQGTLTRAELTKMLYTAVQNLGYPNPLLQEYNISFNTGGGFTVPTQRITRAGYVTRPVNPTRAGYTFDGWYTNAELTNLYNFSDRVYNSFTLYAKWNPVTGNRHSIVVNSGTADKTTALQGQTVTIRANSPAAGKEFDRWTSAGNRHKNCRWLS